MLLGASLTCLAVTASGLLFFGNGAPPLLVDAMALIAVASAFLTICSAEARFAS